jgi:hypothetical protein
MTVQEALTLMPEGYNEYENAEWHGRGPIDAYTGDLFALDYPSEQCRTALIVHCRKGKVIGTELWQYNDLDHENKRVP